MIELAAEAMASIRIDFPVPFSQTNIVIGLLKHKPWNFLIIGIEKGYSFDWGIK